MGGCMGSKEPKPDSDKKPNAQPQGQSKNEGSKKSGEDANPKPTKEIINPITPGKVDEFYEFGKEIGKYVTNNYSPKNRGLQTPLKNLFIFQKN